MKNNEEIAKEVILGKWGNGYERKTRLKKAGYDYNAIQGLVNDMLTGVKKSNTEIADEVIKGLWGNGEPRKQRLTAAGYTYSVIQNLVNEKMKSAEPPKKTETPEQKCMISFEVIAAICGNFWCESGVNSGIWESCKVAKVTDLRRGFGFGQWTNVTTQGRLYRLAQYAAGKNTPIESPTMQLDYLIDEGYWVPSDSYGKRFKNLKDFLTTSETDIEILTHAYTNGWEGIHGNSWNDRVLFAKDCYEYIKANYTNTGISEWKIGNKFLNAADRKNNSVLIARYLSTKCFT